MEPLQEYSMLSTIFSDVRDRFETLSEEDMFKYKSLLVRAEYLSSFYEKKDFQKYTILKGYLDFFNSKINNKNKINFSLVEHGTIAGNQAAKLGTATGFVQRCPECTFPSQRCKC